MTFDLQIFGGSGAGSGRKKGGGGGTPSGITYEEFMKMSEDERYDFMEKIINDPNIAVPNYLDKSITSKVMYGLGMNGKPEVVSDAELDKIAGVDLYRSVINSKDPSMTSQEILDQIRTSDYTRLSGDRSSHTGRALYFADDFFGSAQYSHEEISALMMRAKISPNANVVSYRVLMNNMNGDSSFFDKNIGADSRPDKIALYAIAHGIDGWQDNISGYTMMVNRSGLIVSSTSKKIVNPTNGKYYNGWEACPEA